MRLMTMLPAIVLLAASMAGCSIRQDAPIDTSSISIPAGLPDSQRVLIEDGELTFAEYERALFNLVDCMTAEGIKVLEPDLVDGKFYSYTVAQTDRSDAVVDACDTEHFSYIEQVWADVNPQDPADEQREIEQVASCLRDLGFEVESTQASVVRFSQESPAAFSTCIKGL
ncbi:MAG: hypothetical protein ACI9AD_000481 [Nitriliruptoraceae bacterium]|jgi:hypothetical protein